MNKMPKGFQKYFWDTDFTKIDTKIHQNYVIARLAEYGDKKAYKWLIKNYPKSALKRSIEKNRQVSKRTKNFWQII